MNAQRNYAPAILISAFGIVFLLTHFTWWGTATLIVMLLYLFLRIYFVSAKYHAVQIDLLSFLPDYIGSMACGMLLMDAFYSGADPFTWDYGYDVGSLVAILGITAGAFVLNALFGNKEGVFSKIFLGVVWIAYPFIVFLVRGKSFDWRCFVFLISFAIGAAIVKGIATSTNSVGAYSMGNWLIVFFLIFAVLLLYVPEVGNVFYQRIVLFEQLLPNQWYDILILCLGFSILLGYLNISAFLEENSDAASSVYLFNRVVIMMWVHALAVCFGQALYSDGVYIYFIAIAILDFMAFFVMKDSTSTIHLIVFDVNRTNCFYVICAVGLSVLYYFYVIGLLDLGICITLGILGTFFFLRTQQGRNRFLSWAFVILAESVIALDWSIHYSNQISSYLYIIALAVLAIFALCTQCVENKRRPMPRLSGKIAVVVIAGLMIIFTKL